MYKNSIKTLAVNDRPREKFIKKGSQALRDSELIAILIRSGTTDKSAIVVEQEVLSLANDNLSLLATLQLKDLIKVKGVGHTKATTLMTALELGKQRRFSQAISRTKIVSSKDAFDLM